MKLLDFFHAILPAEGYYALVRIKKQKVKQSFTNDVTTIPTAAQAAVSNEEDFYFGCSSYETPENRTQANVLFIKSFWIDLDCGEGTAYETQAAGFAAVRAFCRVVNFPRPWVVNSGRGLHIYWPLETPIRLAAWQPHAEKLVEIAAKNNLQIKDPKCSIDAARILRVPETFNYKDPTNPTPVDVQLQGESVAWPYFRDLLMQAAGEEIPEEAEPAAPKQPIDPVTAALMGNVTSSFKKLVQLSIDGQGCEVIKLAVEEPNNISEPLWRDALSIAKYCENGNRYAHKISEGHTDYSYEETENKLTRIKGPHFCKTFAEDGAAEMCSRCPNKGKITTPITLGKELKISTTNLPATPILTPNNERPIMAKMELPPLPTPYVRGMQGGIYRIVQDAAGHDHHEKIYPYDLDVVRRIRDPEKGETLIIRHARPRDGVEEIMIPLADTQSLERMKDKLGYHGVAAHKEQMNKIGAYIISAVQHMQKNAAAEPAYTQMGWTPDRHGIIWGRTMFTKDGEIYCPPSSKSIVVAGMMKEHGKYEEWEKIVARYAEPGFELHACVLLSAFGSMLNYYTYEDPVWIHLVSSDSGTGKTTLTNVINSIWGEPLSMKLTVLDTVNAIEKRRVVFNSMAICQDEITNLPPEKLSMIAYAQSQGREKLRLNSGSQEIVNTDRRTNNLITNGNVHIADALGVYKTNAAGEFARLVEIPFAPLPSVMTGEDHFGKILYNYGLAGPRYARWLVAHEQELQARVDFERTRFQREFRSVSKERNWVALTATTFAAGKILQDELGMLKMFDLNKLYRAWTDHMRLIRTNVESQIVAHRHIIGDFLNENIANIVIPDANVAATIAQSPATATLYGRKNEREARNKMVVRWEKHTNTMFVSQTELKSYCLKRNHSFVDLVAYYRSTKEFKNIVVKALGEGTGVVSAPIKTLAFDTSVGDFKEMVEETMQ